MLELFDPIILVLAPVIFIAGFIDSIAGGGGLLTVPAYMIAGIHPAFLLGTNKFVSSAGTVASTSKYILNKMVIWPIAIVGLPCTLAGSSYGAYTIAHLDSDVVRKWILILLPIAAALTLIPKPKTHKETPISWNSPLLWIAVPLICFAIGWYDGFFGPGTGSFLILALYGIIRLNFVHAAALGRLFNLASNVSALVVFILNSKVLYHLAIPLAIASIGGHYIGSHLAIKRGAGLVRLMLVVSCTFLFSYLVWEHFGK